MVQSPDSEPFRTEILEFLKQKRGIDPARVTDDSRLADDLGLDSLALVEMGFALLTQHGLMLDDDQILRLPRFAGALDTFVRGHQLADRADDLILVAGLALAVYAGARRWVPVGVAFLGGVLAFVPPRILPGVGAVLLLAWTAAERRGVAPALVAPDPSATRAGG